MTHGQKNIKLRNSFVRFDWMAVSFYRILANSHYHSLV